MEPSFKYLFKILIYLLGHDLDIFVWFYRLQLVAFQMDTLLCIETSCSLVVACFVVDRKKYINIFQNTLFWIRFVMHTLSIFL